MLARLLKLLQRIASRRTPIHIGGRENPYMIRWHLLPRNPVFNVYLHEFRRSDDDRATHDHPWWSLSVILAGRYVEHDNAGWRLCTAGRVRLRSAKYAHRIDLIDGQPCWTLFITGPRMREWGFHCPWGWRHWREFTTGEHGERVGRGCD